MKVFFQVIILITLIGCDKSRLFEKDFDFKNFIWDVKEVPSFEFEVTDSTQVYNVYYKIRNSNDYPFARIFVKYNLISPSKKIMETKLVSNFLFDQKTGMPLGSSAIGDRFDNRFLILAHQKFKEVGRYKITIEQFMRTDMLTGIEAVGIRVEKTE